MQLTINGRQETCPDSLTISSLLEHLEVKPERVAVEVNENIVKRVEYKTHNLNDGDTLEILNFVGGG